LHYFKKLTRVLPHGIRRTLGGVRRRLRASPAKNRRHKQRLLKDPALAASEHDLLIKVDSRISPDDGMYTGNGVPYFKVGLSANSCIDEAIEAAGIKSVSRVLDLPCGYGRVLRFLVRRFPNASFTASDLDRAGVDFCVDTFGAKGVYSVLDPASFSLGSQFDLIWCGSLVTHLNEAGISHLLAFFSRHLSPGGLLVFTTHSEEVIRRMLNHEFEYGIPQESTETLIEGYRRQGFAFVDYPGADDYGISLTSRSWLRAHAEKIGLKEVYFRETGWDHHQDVYGWVNS